MSDLINLAQARELLKQAVDTQGRDFVYNDTPGPGVTCFNEPYTDDMVDQHGEPYDYKPCTDSPKRKTGCIVGTAMKLGGVPFKPGWAGGDAKTSYGDSLQDAALNYFTVAQRVQDSGKTWGEAYDDAERWAETFGAMAAISA